MADPRIRRQTYTAASQPFRGAYPRGSVPPQAQRGVGSRGSGSGRATAGGDAGSGERQPAETAEQAAERELCERREQERAQEERESDARERKAQAAERLQREQQAVVSLERSVHAKARDVESLSAQSTQMDEQASAIRARVAVLCAHSLQVNGFRAYLGAGNRGLRDCKARINSLIFATEAAAGSSRAAASAAPAAPTSPAVLLSFPGGLADLAPIEWSELPVGSFLERARLHPEGLVAVLQGAVERKAEEIRRECVGTDSEEEGSRLGLATLTRAPLSASGGRTEGMTGGSDSLSGSGGSGSGIGGGTSRNLLRKAAKHASFTPADGGAGAATAAAAGAGGSTGRGVRGGTNQQRRPPQSTQELVLARQKEYRDLCLQTQVLSKRAEAVRLAVERKSAGGASRLGDGKGRREGAGERGEEGGEEGEEKGEEGGGEEGEGDEEDVELGIAMAEAELRVLQAAEKRLSSEVAAAGATNRRVLQQWERIKGFNDERSNKWAEYELIRRINQAYAHMWWNLTNGATQKALAGHVAKAGSALIGSVRAARDLAVHEVTAGAALPPSWLCRPVSCSFPLRSETSQASQASQNPLSSEREAQAQARSSFSFPSAAVEGGGEGLGYEQGQGQEHSSASSSSAAASATAMAADSAVAQFVDAMSAAADVAAGSAAELEPAVASMARQLSGLQQQAEQQHMEVLSEWLPQLAQLQGQSRQLVARTQNASDLVSHWWKQPALGIIPWVTVEGRSMEEWAVALEAAQMQRER
ncbi:unnamed protein product [Closterium sp. Naga37s-1]|nr:unnamed protein product [Closterium sp. Naga37s-1]